MAKNDEISGRLTPRQAEFITALISLPSVAAAAKATKVGDSTARRWLKQEHFKAAYNQARRDAFSESLAVLMSGTTAALSTILKLMHGKDTSDGIKLRAAQIWLEQALQVHKVEVLEQQVAELQAIIKERGA